MNSSLTWFWLSLFFALWTSFLILIIKRLTRTIDPLVLIFVNLIFSLPFLFILILYLGGIPDLSLKFYTFMFFSSIFDTIAAISSFLAISLSPISLISPISSFNPVFTTTIAAITIGEIPSFIKVAGILTIVLGAYLLNVSDIKGGLLLPFKKLFTNRGVLFFLLANFLWAITPIFQKQAIFETQPQMPLFPSFFGTILVSIFMLPIVVIKTKNPVAQIKEVRKNWYWFLLLAPFGTLAQWAAFTAFSLQNLGLVTSVFKLSVLFTILWGFLFFKEERIWERLLGAGVMILGTILLVQ